MAAAAASSDGPTLTPDDLAELGRLAQDLLQTRCSCISRADRLRWGILLRDLLRGPSDPARSFPLRSPQSSAPPSSIVASRAPSVSTTLTATASSGLHAPESRTPAPSDNVEHSAHSAVSNLRTPRVDGSYRPPRAPRPRNSPDQPQDEPFEEVATAATPELPLGAGLDFSYVSAQDLRLNVHDPDVRDALMAEWSKDNDHQQLHRIQAFDTENVLLLRDSCRLLLDHDSGWALVHQGRLYSGPMAFLAFIDRLAVARLAAHPTICQTYSMTEKLASPVLVAIQRQNDNLLSMKLAPLEERATLIAASRTSLEAGVARKSDDLFAVVCFVRLRSKSASDARWATESLVRAAIGRFFRQSWRSIAPNGRVTLAPTGDRETWTEELPSGRREFINKCIRAEATHTRAPLLSLLGTNLLQNEAIGCSRHLADAVQWVAASLARALTGVGQATNFAERCSTVQQLSFGPSTKLLQLETYAGSWLRVGLRQPSMDRCVALGRPSPITDGDGMLLEVCAVFGIMSRTQHAESLTGPPALEDATFLRARVSIVDPGAPTTLEHLRGLGEAWVQVGPQHLSLPRALQHWSPGPITANPLPLVDVRLVCIDAPEVGSPGAATATAALANMWATGDLLVCDLLLSPGLDAFGRVRIIPRTVWNSSGTDAATMDLAFASAANHSPFPALPPLFSFLYPRLLARGYAVPTPEFIDVTLLSELALAAVRAGLMFQGSLPLATRRQTADSDAKRMGELLRELTPVSTSSLDTGTVTDLLALHRLVHHSQRKQELVLWLHNTWAVLHPGLCGKFVFRIQPGKGIGMFVCTENEARNMLWVAEQGRMALEQHVGDGVITQRQYVSTIFGATAAALRAPPQSQPPPTFQPALTHDVNLALAVFIPLHDTQQLFPSWEPPLHRKRVRGLAKDRRETHVDTTFQVELKTGGAHGDAGVLMFSDPHASLNPSMLINEDLVDGRVRTTGAHFAPLVVRSTASIKQNVTSWLHQAAPLQRDGLDAFAYSPLAGLFLCSSEQDDDEQRPYTANGIPVDDSLPGRGAVPRRTRTVRDDRRCGTIILLASVYSRGREVCTFYGPQFDRSQYSAAAVPDSQDTDASSQQVDQTQASDNPMYASDGET